MEDIVKAEWLHEQLQKGSSDYIIIDTRFSLADPQAGKNLYKVGHLPGAIYVDLDKDLSSEVTLHGGRHPLPDKNELVKKLGQWGIGEKTSVVVYDDQGGMVASRFFWLLKHFGHEHVALLDGGYSNWVSKGFPVTTDTPAQSPKTFRAKLNPEWSTVDARQVKEKLFDPNTILVDSREPNRYLGIEEPIDAIAGHIPGALNYFWKEVLNEKGEWKKEAELKHLFSSLPNDKEMIVYCGSGVSACPNVIALKKAGFSNVKLYSGSWSDWITHANYPVNLKPETT
ncbi:thiosulfate sulfurtransferase [Halalkalibacter wakoensis JCM 9140]|uniref:Thiosulfate sulfurtransferase n=1 Tax=Halalkalibacter wakoensis JCM 9140 TaxID=1236970 RepID=W4Q1E8_9BACI|nr:sulfurtransferase [Halalkalibacter wakoensis]GAE25199.1 thiosulfate sulfurtransferase [Halalkalibacter wakoensis JCM 9140]